MADFDFGVRNAAMMSHRRRVRYLVDKGRRIVYLVYASPRHPKDTDS